MTPGHRLRALIALCWLPWIVACSDAGGIGLIGPSRTAEAIVADRVLLEAADGGRLDQAAFALDLGADVDATDRADQRTALMVAANGGWTELVELLLAMDADTDRRNADGWTALMFAVNGGHADIARRLLAAGADPEAEDPTYGFTPLMVAALMGDADMIAALADGGAEIGRRSRYEGDTPLILAAAGGRRTAPSAVAELLVRGAELEAANNGGLTALLAATLVGSRPAMQVLLDEGADPEVRSTQGYTSLGLAALRGDPALVRALLSADADPNRPAGEGLAPLLVAVANGHVDAAALLITAGAEVDAIDPRQGRTALILAADRGDAAMVDMLLDLGADITAAGADGMTARAVAERQGHTIIVELLSDVDSAGL